MGRPPITFTSDEWRAIAAAATSANEAAPNHANNEFLDQFIAGVARTTGQLYGQTLYERMLLLRRAQFEVEQGAVVSRTSRAIF